MHPASRPVRLLSAAGLALAVLAPAAESPAATADRVPSAAEHARQLGKGGDGTFKVMSSRSWTDGAAGGVNIVADLKNVTKSWRGKIRVVVKLRNRFGKVLDTEIAYAQTLAVRPGARTPLEFWDSKPKHYHHFSLAISSRRTELRTVRRLRTAPGKPYVDQLGRLTIRVKVRNRSAFRVEHVFVYLTLLDRKGRIVNADNGYNYTKPRSLRPGQTGRMRESWGAHFRSTHRIRIQVEAFRA